MKFEVETARNGEKTLKLNNRYIYSKYRPREEAGKFIQNEFDQMAQGYLLLGLGLGYHLEEILKLAPDKKIYVLLIDSDEKGLFEKNALWDLSEFNNVEIIWKNSDRLYLENFQLILPSSWIMAIEKSHPLYAHLEDMKVRQMSFKSSKVLMKENFEKNLKNQDPDIHTFKDKFAGFSACLVSAGPSLDYSFDLLKAAKNKYFILSVGSALKSLLKNGIVPDGVIITDPQPSTIKQLLSTDFKGILFYLATANHEMTLLHPWQKFILFQEGYKPAEKEAAERRAPILETGGSVATTALSLLELMGFQNVYLFGQDLGFKNQKTHADFSSSLKSFESNIHFQKVLSNSGEYIHTLGSYNIFRRWIERKVTETQLHIYNTSWEGAKIKGVPFINQNEFSKILDPLIEYDFQKFFSKYYFK